MAKENIKGKKDIMSFAGTWKNVEDKEKHFQFKEKINRGINM